jgi:4-carboxymuconolactone decarboxylase
MSSERFERGAKKLNELVEGGDLALLANLETVSPDLGRYALEFIFGDLYSRPGLDLKTKQLLTITILASQGNANKPQLAYHINAALNIGITRQEIIDVMIHVAGYSGFPCAMNGTITAKEIFEYRDQLEKAQS